MTGCAIPRRGIYYVRLTYYDMNHRRRDKWVSTGLSGRGAKQKATAIQTKNKQLCEAIRVRFCIVHPHW